jgi:protein gp37
MDEQWARSLRDLCAAKHIASWFKQHSGRYSQIGMKLDGVEHHEFPAAWDVYKPPGQLLEQVSFLDSDLN